MTGKKVNLLFSYWMRSHWALMVKVECSNESSREGGEGKSRLFGKWKRGKATVKPQWQ